MRITSRLVGKISFSVMAVALVLSLAGIGECYYERYQAEKLLGTVAAIQVGSTTKTQAKEMLKPYSRYSTLRYFDEASADEFDQYGFLNRTLAALHLATRTWVWITIDYKEGVVTSKSVQAASEPRCSGSVAESLRNDIPSAVEQTDTGRTMGIDGSPGQPYFGVQVRDDLSTPAVRRQLDWQIDLSCMTWRQGCTDPRKTLYGAFLPATSERRK